MVRHRHARLQSRPTRRVARGAESRAAAAAVGRGLADEYGAFTRGELDDDALMLVEPCFGEEIAP
ncbi:MAG: hypothetical protein AB2L07_10675 [Thermoanaerobaculaceae bacterium]